MVRVKTSKRKAFVSYTYLNMPDGTVLLMTTVENIGTPEQRVIRHISEERRKQITDEILMNVGRSMSDYYSDKFSAQLRERT